MDLLSPFPDRTRFVGPSLRADSASIGLFSHPIRPGRSISRANSGQHGHFQRQFGPQTSISEAIRARSGPFPDQILLGRAFFRANSTWQACFQSHLGPARPLSERIRASGTRFRPRKAHFRGISGLLSRLSEVTPAARPTFRGDLGSARRLSGTFRGRCGGFQGAFRSWMTGSRSQRIDFRADFGPGGRPRGRFAGRQGRFQGRICVWATESRRRTGSVGQVSGPKSRLDDGVPPPARVDRTGFGAENRVVDPLEDENQFWRQSPTRAKNCGKKMDSVAQISSFLLKRGHVDQAEPRSTPIGASACLPTGACVRTTGS